MSRVVPALAAVAVLSFLQPASADPIDVYTSRASWETALGGVIQTENFNGLTPGALSLGSNSAGLIDIDISGSSVRENAINDGSHPLDIDGSNFYLGDVARSVTGASTLVSLVFPGAVLGFGADWESTTSLRGLTVTINGETVVFSDHLTGLGSGFLGFVAASSFTEADLDLEENTSGANELFGMDDISFGDGDRIPEPLSLALLAAGTVALALRRRRTVQ